MSAQTGTVTRRLFSATSLFTLLAVALGAVVCASDSGFECGNWPGCTGTALLPGGPVAGFFYRNPWIEMIHRTSAILAGPAALLAALLVARRRDLGVLVRVLPWVTVAGALVAGYVGRGVVLGTAFPSWVAAADLGAAMTAMGAILVATVALGRAPYRWVSSRPGRFGWAAVGLLVAMHLVSLYAAGDGSFTRCMSWPVWRLLDADTTGNVAAQVLRMVLAVAAGVAIVGAVAAARHSAELRGPRVAAGVLLAAVLLFGLVIGFTGSTDLGVPFAVVSVGLLFTMVLLAARADIVPAARLASPAEDRAEATLERS